MNKQLFGLPGFNARLLVSIAVAMFAIAFHVSAVIAVAQNPFDDGPIEIDIVQEPFGDDPFGGAIIQVFEDPFATEPLDIADAYLQTTSNLVDAALGFFASQHSLTAADVETIKDNLKDELESGNAETFTWVSQTNQLDPAIRTALYSELKPFIGEEEFDALNRSREFLGNEQERIGQLSALWLVDQFASLSEPQQQKVLEEIRKNWNDQLSAGAGRILYGERSLAFTLLPQIAAQMEGELSAEQIQILNDPTLTSIGSFTGNNSGTLEGFSDSYVETMRVVVKAKIAEIDALCQLAEDQKNRLDVAGTIAMMKAAEERFDAWNDYANTGVDGNMRAYWKYAYEPSAQTIFRQKAWTKSVEKALDDAQTEKWTERESIRRSITKELMAGSFTSAISAYFPMTQKQYEDFQQMILIEVSDETFQQGRFQVSLGVTFMPEENYRHILTPAQMEYLTARFEASRQSFGELEPDWELEPDSGN